LGEVLIDEFAYVLVIGLLRKVFHRVHVIGDLGLIMVMAANGLLLEAVVVLLLKFPVVFEGFGAELHDCELELVADGFGQILDNVEFCEKSVRVRLSDSRVIKNVPEQQYLPKLPSLQV
jgi:hypothetical protein